MTIKESERKERVTTTTAEDIRIMMITEGMRGAIAIGIAIAIIRRRIVPLIAAESGSESEGWTTVSHQKDKVRVSRVNLL